MMGACVQAAGGKIKLEYNAVHSNHLRVTKKDQGLVGKCKAALTLSVQKVCGAIHMDPENYTSPRCGTSTVRFGVACSVCTLDPLRPLRTRCA